MEKQLALVAGLTDDELEDRLLRLARGEQQVLVVFLAHLAEFDRRRAQEARGFPSLFEYCTRRLGLSDGEAYSRIRAARAGMRFPRILGMLACGQLHLSAVVRLAPYLNSDNATSLLDRACGASKREVERLAAEFEVGVPQIDIVRALPRPAKEPGNTVAAGVELDLEGIMPAAPASPLAGDPAPVERLVRISFTATEELLSRIERARALLRHKFPAGRLEQIVGEAVEALLEVRDPQRTAARKKARKRNVEDAPAVVGERPIRATRRIPQRVKDEVWQRDGGRCSFVSSDGRRCDSVEWLEFDHIIPWALGGRSDDAGNVRLLCRTHNQHARREVFGGD